MLITWGDAELKDEVKPGETKDDSKKKADEGEEATLADVVKLLGNVSDRLDSIGKRCDALEAKRGDKAEYDEDLPEPLAADDARHRSDGFKARAAAERADAAARSNTRWLIDWSTEPAMRTSTRPRTKSSRPWKPNITSARMPMATRVGTLRPGRTRS